MLLRVYRHLLFDNAIQPVGFSTNQLDGGNRVLLVNEIDDEDVIQCDVIIYYSGSEQIVCDTRYIYRLISTCIPMVYYCTPPHNMLVRNDHHLIAFLRPTQHLEVDTRYRITVQVNDGTGRGFEDIETVCSSCIYTVSL